MIIHDVQQGTAEWFELRKGKFTASCFSDLFMKDTTQGFNDAINRVVYERATGEIPEVFVSEWMKRGTELEPEAREQYELITFNNVNQVGFIELNEFVGYSPDGLIGDDGLLEIKCPKYSTLIDYKISDKIPTNYMWQMQGGLFVTGRKWIDFFVYHPKMRPLLKRIERDEKMINDLDDKLSKCIEIVKERVEILK